MYVQMQCTLYMYVCYFMYMYIYMYAWHSDWVRVICLQCGLSCHYLPSVMALMGQDLKLEFIDAITLSSNNVCNRPLSPLIYPTPLPPHF